MKEQPTYPEQVSAEALLEELLQPHPVVIGVEGGPCGGKTTLVEHLAANPAGREVVILPEAATQHITKLAEQGVTVPELIANDREGFLAFEADVLQTIIGQIEQAKVDYAGTDAIIVADRVDIGAYVSDGEYRHILDQLGLDKPPMLDIVDQLYYLPSVAVENPAKYDELQASNAARYENLEQAQATCQANLAAVARHPELHVAWGGNFDQKIERLTRDIMDPETEAEFALEYFDPTSLMQDIKSAYQSGRFLSQSRITQSYHQLSGHEFRLRHTRTARDESVYSFAIKTGRGTHRHELQRPLSEADYRLLLQAPQEGRTLHKTRYEFLRPHDLPGRGWRKWTADYYDAPDLQYWQAEIGLQDDTEEELFPWNIYDEGNRVARPAIKRARDLAAV